MSHLSVQTKLETVSSDLHHYVQKQVQYSLGNPTYMGPRYRRITECDGLLEKVGTNLLSCTQSSNVQHHSVWPN
jgi:hypothetical protein